MKAFLVLVILGAALTAASTAKVVCYYSSWAVYGQGSGKLAPADIDPSLCTHLNYAFVSITSGGGLKSEDQYADVDLGGYKNTVALKKKNPNLKVLLSIGGASSPSQTFAKIAADPGKRAAMVGSARWFMETYKFDGVDLDWEIPNSADKNNLISLLQDFRNDFNRNGWLVSAAVSAAPGDGYNVPKMSELLDHINIMTYDMYGPWSAYTGQNSALYASSKESQWEKDNLNMKSAVQQWINKGADKKKLIPGIAFYGHTFTLTDKNNNGVHAPISGPGKATGHSATAGTLYYIDYCEQKGSWNCKWDDQQKNPICLNGNQWLGFDNEDSVRAKADYIKNNGLGGGMVWSIDQDDNHGSCGAAKPLLHALHNALK